MKIYVDYNAELPDGRFAVRHGQLDQPFAVGVRVESYDEDGNSLDVIVDEIDTERGLAYVRPDWSTWLDRGPSPVIPAGSFKPGNVLIALRLSPSPAVQLGGGLSIVRWRSVGGTADAGQVSSPMWVERSPV